MLLKYYTVPQQPPQCSCNSLMYQHNLSSAPIVLYCTNKPYPCSCSILLYHHILASASIVLFCTNIASRVSYRTLKYQLSLTTVPVVLYNPNIASPLLLYYSTKLMHPPKCPFTTLPEHIAFKLSGHCQNLQKSRLINRNISQRVIFAKICSRLYFSRPSPK